MAAVRKRAFVRKGSVLVGAEGWRGWFSEWRVGSEKRAQMLGISDLFGREIMYVAFRVIDRQGNCIWHLLALSTPSNLFKTRHVHLCHASKSIVACSSPARPVTYLSHA